MNVVPRSFSAWRLSAAIVAFLAAPAPAQMLISTGTQSGARLYQTGGNDWWIDPTAGRFDVRVNGGATPVMKVDSAGGVTSSSHTLTGTGTGSPFDLTTSSGVHILSGKLKLEPGSWIEYADGTVTSSSATAATVVAPQIVASTEVYPHGTTTQTGHYACIAGSTATITVGNNRLLISFTGSIKTASWDNTGVSVLLDGGYLPGYSSALGVTGFGCGPNSANSSCNFSFAVLSPVLSAGTHSVCLTAEGNTGGTITVPDDALNTASTAKLSLVEVNTGGSGYSMPASSFTALAPGNFTSTTLSTAYSGSSVTLTTTGGDVEVFFSGTAASNGATDVCAGFLADGQFIDGEASAGPTCGTGMSDGTVGSNTWGVNLSFVHRIKNVSAGTHTYALVLGCASGTCTLGATNGGSAKQVLQFGAQEIKVSAGAGDVATNGNNTLSGTNTFSGSVTFNGNVTFSGNTRRYFRLTTTNGTSGTTQSQVAELELYDSISHTYVTNNMTSASAPSPKSVSATATSYTSSAGWMVFDGAGPDCTYNNGYMSSSANAQITLDLGSGNGIRLTKYRLWTSCYSDGGGTYRPKAWTLESSNDGSTWTTVDSRSGMSPPSGGFIEYDCATVP